MVHDRESAKYISNQQSRSYKDSLHESKCKEKYLISLVKMEQKTQVDPQLEIDCKDFYLIPYKVSIYLLFELIALSQDMISENL